LRVLLPRFLNSQSRCYICNWLEHTYTCYCII